MSEREMLDGLLKQCKVVLAAREKYYSATGSIERKDAMDEWNGSQLRLQTIVQVIENHRA